MKVHFIGAGPGAADLITLRGARLLGQAGMVLYAGSLVPTGMLQHCRADAEVIDTAQLNLDEQEACYRRAQSAGIDVARLHSGDPSIYGATAEQMRRLEALGIEYEVVPGVSSFAAAAAAVRTELTRPEVSQTIILTRVSGRASAVPDAEAIALLAAHRATMCIFLSGPHLRKIVGDLRQHYPDETPVKLVHRASWADQRIYEGTLGRVLLDTKRGQWNLTTMLLVGEAMNSAPGVESRLYAKDYTHLFRVVKKPRSKGSQPEQAELRAVEATRAQGKATQGKAAQAKMTRAKASQSKTIQTKPAAARQKAVA